MLLTADLVSALSIEFPQTVELKHVIRDRSWVTRPRDRGHVVTRQSQKHAHSSEASGTVVGRRKTHARPKDAVHTNKPQITAEGKHQYASSCGMFVGSPTKPTGSVQQFRLHPYTHTHMHMLSTAPRCRNRRLLD